MIVSLIGSDGAGKSTISRLVAERLAAAGKSVERVDRWDIVGNPAYPTAAFLTPDVERTRQRVAEMPPQSRFLFLMWSMAHALLGRSQPRESGRDTLILLDGYWMKHAASEIAYGLDRAWVEGVASGLPASPRVLYLRLDPKLAWGRKAGRDVVPYECGMDPACSRDGFLAHQHRILDILDTWAERFGWLVIDAGEPLEDVVAQVMTALSPPRGL